MANTINALVRDNFDSISEGCFLVMPQKKRQIVGDQLRKSKKSKANTKEMKVALRTEEESQTILHDGFQQLFNGQETINSMLHRKDAFTKAWKQVDEMITSTLLNMNQSAVQNICDFVNKNHDVCDSLISLPFHEIPTALVFAGINTPDHGTQFAHIASKLREPTYPHKKHHVALLQSKDCLNIKNMVKTMIERFLMDSPDLSKAGSSHQSFVENHVDNEDDMDDDEDIIRPVERSNSNSYNVGHVSTKPSKCLPFDMQLLEGWYRYRHLSNGDNANLVIVLQDFESFEPSVLQDFFTICSEYRQRLPIVCIVGIATSTEILHQSLSKSTIGLLRIEKFKLEQSEAWFNRAIEDIFLDSKSTLKFGSRPYKFLLDHFYLYDYSISKATANIKYALMHHFYGNPLSILLPLLSLEQQDMVNTLSTWLDDEIISQHHIIHLRMLSSFRAYIESLVPTDPKKALRLLEDDTYLITQIVPMLLSDIKLYQEEFKMGINLLVLLQAQFPSFTSFTSLRKPKRLLLLEALEAREGFTEKGDLVKSLVVLIRKIDEAHIGRLLEELSHFVQHSDYQHINQTILQKLEEWQARYDQLVGAEDSVMTKMDRKAKIYEGMVLPEAQSAKGRRTETARKVQTQNLEHLRMNGSEISKIAMDIADWCETTLTHFLRSFTKLPLYELVYYTNSKLHEKSFASQPRASVQTALTQPQHYTNCSCCNLEKSDQILPTEHDACILYKLYLECGRLINLYDWFYAFGSIIERETRPRNKLEENEVQARFIRSVAELQFLGFIKPTQRKTDHVIRLTWSNI